MNKKLICLLVAVVLLVGYGFRVWYVNANAYPMYEKEYEMGEWVPLEGDYFNAQRENTDGYSVCLEKAEVLTYEEFMNRYDKDLDYLADSSQHDVVLLTINVKNEDNDSGYIYINGFTIMNKYKSTYYNIDETYNPICEPNLDVSIGGGVCAVRPGTEYTLHLAYTAGSRADGVTFLQEEAEKGKSEADVLLNISWYPTKKLIRFKIPIPENPQ